MRRAAYALSIVFAAFAAALLVAIVSSVSTSSEVIDKDTAADLAFQPNPGAQLPLSAKLIDENGRVVSLGEFFTKSPVILMFEYLRCQSLCGVTLHNIVAGALNRLPLQGGRDYQVVAISIDPRDKPEDAAEARAKYAGQLDGGDGSGLHFLTAAPEVVRQIADTVGFQYRYDSFLDAYLHSAGFVVASPDGEISRYIEGVAISPQELIDALSDAQQGKSPGLLTRIILFCQGQGRPSGRFTVPVLAALMLANIAAGLGLIAIFAAIRRQM